MEKKTIVRDSRGRFKPKEVEIKPTREWGYFFGLVIGDGWIKKTKFHNYIIGVESTKKELIDIFVDCAKRLGLNPHVYSRVKRRRFPNGTVREDLMYRAIVNSKQIYELLRSCKLEDYHFKIPNLVYESKEAIVGFLEGYFDAEGCVVIRKNPSQSHILIASKHRDNLEQITMLFNVIGVKAHIEKRRENCWVLRIWDYKSKVNFYNQIKPRIKEKAEKLVKLFHYQPTSTHYKYPLEVYLKAFELRRKGLSYQKIEDILGIPHSKRSSSGVVCRWINRKKIPYSVRYAPPDIQSAVQGVIHYGGEG